MSIGILAVAVGAIGLLASLAARVEARSGDAGAGAGAGDPLDGAPRLRIGSVDAVFLPPAEGELPQIRVPVLVDAARDANYIRLRIQYDDSLLSYQGITGTHGDWEISRVTGFRERAEGLLGGVLVRPRIPSGGDPMAAETQCAELLFGVRNRLSEDPNLLREKTRVSFLESSEAVTQETFVGYCDLENERTATPEPLPTRLEAGDLTVYYQSFAEVRGGGLTRRSQTFTLPLLVTHVGERPEFIAIGVDYDELILREVRPATPTIVGRSVPVARTAEGTATFELEVAPAATDAPLLEAHVADLVFHYDGETPPSARAIHVLPRILEIQSEGTGGRVRARSVSGVLHFIGARFVRGNVDSSVNVAGIDPFGPDLGDVLRILRHLYLGAGDELECREAADVDDSGSVDMADAIALVNHLFRGGPAPPPPFEDPGHDPVDSPVDLGCDRTLPWFEPTGSATE